MKNKEELNYAIPNVFNTRWDCKYHNVFIINQIDVGLGQEILR